MKTSTIFISHSRRDERLVGALHQAFRNVGHSTIIEEYIPRTQQAEIPYEEIRRNVERSNYVFLFLTDNVVATEYTKNWIAYEVGVASALERRLFVFERKGFVLPYPVPYVTDYMIFDEADVQDLLKIQSVAKKVGEVPPALIGGGAGAAAGILFGPLGMLVGGIIGAFAGAAAMQPLLRLRCNKVQDSIQLLVVPDPAIPLSGLPHGHEHDDEGRRHLMPEKTYPVQPEKVFEVLRRACSTPPYKIQRIEENVRRLRVSAGMSLFSWGENLDVIVYPNSRGCIVRMEGAGKLPINVTADPQRHFREIFRRLDRGLESGVP